MIRFLAVLTIALGLPALAGAAAPASAEENPACAAAMPLLDEAARGEAQGRAALRPPPSASRMLTFTGPDGALLTAPGDDGRSGWFTIESDLPVEVAPPALATIRAFTGASPASATDCADFLREALARGLRLVRETEKPRLRGGLYAVRIQTVGLPVVSPDGAEALAYVDSTAGPLAGGGNLVLLRRAADGGWTIAGRLVLWIS
ncbi:hypothetical protein AS593_17600 [Caulobacter vibrioides]|nr:hypothetical protein AS593_17600 [Caulobacter vibrioides]